MQNQGFRIRLYFDENISFSESEEEIYRKCWFIVPRIALNISDLSHLILKSFDLKSKCPHGILLLMKSFVLLPSYNIGVIREDDLIQ